MKEDKPKWIHPFEKNQITMNTDEVFAETEKILDSEWYDEIYPTLFGRINRICPKLVQECAEMSKNLHTYIFAVREFTRIYFEQYMAQTPINDEGVELDIEIRSLRDDPLFNESGIRINNPVLFETQTIPEIVTIQTKHGVADFSKREIEAMILHSSPMN